MGDCPLIAEQMTFPPSPLAILLETFRDNSQSEREKGNYFEKLVKLYLTKEPYYAHLYAGKILLLRAGVDFVSF